MYINKVIEAVDRVYPNEYTLQEKYDWCDELSAMLANEYRKEYDKITLSADDNGDYLLPEGVSFEMIDRIFDGHTMLEKQDFRAEGVIYLSGISRRIVIKNPYKAKNDIDVIYLRQHEPIRNIKIITTVDFFDKNADGSDGSSGFILSEKDPIIFRQGDIVNIQLGGSDIKYKDVPILKVRYGEIIKSIISSRPGGTVQKAIVKGRIYEIGRDFSDSPFQNLISFSDTEIERHVTEKTVCDAPYDSMYIDYLLAKICYYQHDYESYNQHINLFNSKLISYQMWLKEREPMRDRGRMENWW